MAIDVGQILDKYELIEKVGQGGMAVVYRGMDRSLHRQVAIKVLHDHLADHPEARDRFAREARAVAKLRHENILEIFDFSGAHSDSSYIVTEFIDGRTLEELMSEHAFTQPEIGAMIMVDVCRALSHAHSLGVLHRDVKPENIMVRRDGVVKLMDFGIAQMLDMQRLTVTGQLLGSPAYMAPEHVTGAQLDFRTDVFAVGIVLYQLTVGHLPFQGQNPHELLRRIAECVYRDPRKANPLVGKTLGRIIARALAREPDQRFADISHMQDALERYLADECGLTDLRRELTELFAGPAAYERALTARLCDHSSRRARDLADKDPVAALELYNRVLTMDPERTDVLADIERMSRKRRRARLAAALAAVFLAAVLVLVVSSTRSPENPGALPGDKTASNPDTPDTANHSRDTAPSTGDTALFSSADRDVRGHADAGAMLALAGDAGAPPGDAGPGMMTHADARTGPREPGHKLSRPRQGHARAADAGAARPPATDTRRFVLKVAQRRSEYRLDEGPWLAAGQETSLDVPGGAHTIEVRNPLCCQNEKRHIPADAAGGVISMSLSYLPASITPRCDNPGVSVQIDNRPAELGRPNVVVMGGALGMQEVRVTFIGQRSDTQTLTLHYNEDRDIQCRFD